MAEINQEIISEVLAKNKITRPEKIEKFTSGQINNVYNLGDVYVIKIESDVKYIKGLFRHQVALEPKLRQAGAVVPKIIDCGEARGKDYLLMQKLPGDNLINGWRGFTDSQKENFIAQLVLQLKIFHTIKFDRYGLDAYLGEFFDNYKAAVAKMADFNSLDLDKLDPATRSRVDLLKSYFEENLDILDETGTAVLVHNDIQWENVFYAGEAITGIIDFDWSAQAPRDYELGKFVDFLLYPKNYVSESLEKYYQGQKLVNEWAYFKKYYSEMFQTKNLLARLKYYYVIYMIWLIRECQRGRWTGIEGILAEARAKIDYIFAGGGEFDNFILG